MKREDALEYHSSGRPGKTILVGMNRPVHMLERGADVQDIVNMAAVAVMDAQERSTGRAKRTTREQEQTLRSR